MFENSKEILRGWFGSGTDQVYLGTPGTYLDQVALPLSLGGKNQFNPSTDAEKISTVITCIKVLSDTIARLPLHVYSETDDGHLPDKEDYRYGFLHFSPDGIITSHSFFSALEYNRNLKGNAFALISRDGKGMISGLHFIPSPFIGGYKMVNGELYYVYYEPIEGTKKTKEKLINSSEMLHFKMTTKNSFWGVNPVELQRLNMSTLWKSKNTVDTYYENNAFSPKVLKSTIPDAAFQKTVVEAVQKFKSVNVGPANAGQIITLPPFTEIQELSLNVIDEQFIAGTKFDAAQLASFYGVPAHMVGIYEYSKFNNVETENLNFKSMTIAGIAKMYRSELEFKLLTEEERLEGKSIEFALNALIELDTATKMNYYKTMKNDLNVLTAKQIALFEGLPIPEEPEKPAPAAPPVQTPPVVPPVKDEEPEEGESTQE